MMRKILQGNRAKWLAGVGIGLLLYTLAGFFLVPAIIKSQMLKRLPALTRRQATLEQVKFNPYALSLTLRGLALKEPDGTRFVAFDELYVNFQLSSVFRWKWTFAEISLKKPFAQITYREDGSFNFANLISPATPQPPNQAPKAPPPLLVHHLNITNGAVAFADLKRQTPFRTQFAPIQVSLTNLTTVRDRNSPYSFVARTDAGEVFAWSGSVSLNPLRSAGRFRLGGLKPAKYSTYAHDYARFEIAEGTLDVAAEYRYDSATSALGLAVSNATAHLAGLVLKTPDTAETVLTIPSLSVEQAAANLADRTARVGRIASRGGSILARRNRDGTVNLLAQLIPSAREPAPAEKPAAEPAAPWSARIGEIAFEDCAVSLEDRKPAKPARFDLDQIAFTLKGVSNLSNAPIAVSLSLRFQGTGSVGLEGTATLLPPSADVQVAVTNLDLRVAQPYVEEQVKLVIASGALSLQGRARYATPGPGAPLLGFAGDLALDRFATTDDVLFKDFARWEALTLERIQLEVQPDKLEVGQAKFVKLSTTLAIGPDRRPNLQTILRRQPETPPNAPPPAAARPRPDVSLDTLLLDNASIHFSDESLEPHCAFDVREFSGTIRGLSSRQDSTATVEVKGNVDDRSPFSITGKVNPLANDLFADLAVTFTNTELTAFTPYCEKYAGRPLEKGKLSFGVHYLIQNKDLKAENGFYVDQLTLGPKNNSPDATKLPVKLAVALLKDRNGRIQLDIPVQGRTDDPKFRVGPIIWQVVVNLMVKAATSPFALLGAAFGGGEELSYVDFPPGSADLAEGEIKKLDTLANALYERPALTLEISGSTDPARDRPALARLRFEEQIRALVRQEQTGSAEPAAASQEIPLEPKEHERLVRRMYKKTLGSYQPGAVAPPPGAGTNVAFATTGGAAAGAATTGPAPQPAQRPRTAVSERGAARLLLPPNLPEIPSGTAKTAAGPADHPLTPGLTPRQAELADMENQLVSRIQVTDDDLRDLMQTRARQVQSRLLQTGKVAAERLFILAPKPLNAAFKGEDRVNLSLN